MSLELSIGAAAYLVAFLLGLLINRTLRGPALVLSLTLLGLAGFTALGYVDLDLRRDTYSLWNTVGDVVRYSQRLWRWCAAFGVGVLYSRFRAARSLRATAAWQTLYLFGAIATAFSVFVLIAVAVMRLSNFRFDNPGNVAVSIEPEYALLGAVRSDAGIGVRSSFFDVPHERSRITVEAAAVTIVELQDARLVGIDTSTPAKPKIVVIQNGVERVISSLADMKTGSRIEGGQRVVIETLHAGTAHWPPDVPPVAVSLTTRRSTSHATLLSSTPIPALLDPGGVQLNDTRAFSGTHEKRWDPDTLQSLLVSFRDNPLWTFGVRWSSTLESETREMLDLHERGVFIMPAIGMTHGDHGGRLRVVPNRAADLMFVLDEAHVFKGLPRRLTGLVLMFAEDASAAEVQPLGRDPSNLADRLWKRWGLATDTLDDSHAGSESLMSLLETGNGQGRITVGPTERVLESDVSTIGLVSRGDKPAGIRVRWVRNRLYGTCSAENVEHVSLNGTSLLPTVWSSLSNETRLGLAGGVLAFLLGMVLANKAETRRLLRAAFWMPSAGLQPLQMSLADSTVVSASEWSFVQFGDRTFVRVASGNSYEYISIETISRFTVADDLLNGLQRDS